MKPVIVEEKEVPMFEVREEFKKIMKRETEPNFRLQKTDEYLNAFTFISLKDGKELLDKLRGLNIPRLQEKHIIKIVDVMPKNIEELKVVMQGYTLTVSNDNLKKIMDTVKEYIK
jgi:DNA-directed RNA polymerase subunit F